MKQLSVLFKLKDKYPDNKKIISLLGEVDKGWAKKEKVIRKTGALNNRAGELFNRLSPDDREELFLKLLTTLYPGVVTDKHPQKRVYLCKLGGHKFFYDVLENNIMMPFPNEEPRTFPAGVFVENMPKLEKFLEYLDTYSMRNRRRFRF
ncbi:hypothetical protein GF352_04195 [archaeon]|nr:hypothetical protein [archaeon]